MSAPGVHGKLPGIDKRVLVMYYVFYTNLISEKASNMMAQDSPSRAAEGAYPFGLLEVAEILHDGLDLLAVRQNRRTHLRRAPIVVNRVNQVAVCWKWFQLEWVRGDFEH